MAAADRLSALPDKVLRRVLSFLEAGDAARTSVLSRRWRTLWLQADAVNLDTEFYGHVGYDGEAAGRLLFRDAMAALTAAGRFPVRRLSINVVSSDHMEYCKEVLLASSPGMDDVLMSPATRQLEELRLSVYAEFSLSCAYELPTSRLSCAASLRVLDLAAYKIGPPARAVFGRLDTLILTWCESSVDTLQAVLDAAPSLATLRLDGFSFTAAEGEDLSYGYDWYAPAPAASKRRVLLRCTRSVAAVTLLHCHGTDGLYLDAPGVRFLRYKGFIEHFPFSSATTPPSGMPANLERVELSFCTTRSCGYPPSREEAPPPPHVVFWESIGSFNHLRFVKLKLLDINDIAVHPDKEDLYLKQFPELKFLEVKGSYEVDKRGAAVTLANFLHCCPAMQELRLKFKVHGDLYALPKGIHLSEERRAQVDLKKFMDLLKRLKSGTSAFACYTVDDDDRSCDDADLLVLQARSFPCLESHLSKIRLKFELEDFNCFEVKIAKFLVENAVVLEKMEVHDGHQRVHDHIHRKLAIWRASSSNSKIDIVGEQEPRM